MLTAQIRKKLRDFELNIEFTVQSGEVLVLLGENGSGKSTVLNLLAGLSVPDEGEVILNDRILFSNTTSVSLLPEERNIGYVFQNYALFPHMTVFENIAFGLRVRKKTSEEIKEKINQVLRDLGIHNLKGEWVLNLSGGQRQRVALARALVIQPDLLLLDEPLTALDQASKEKIRVELREQLVYSRQPAILVTHSLKDAIVIGDRVIMLQQGRSIWTGRPVDLKSGTGEPDLSEFKNDYSEYIDFGLIAID